MHEQVSSFIEQSLIPSVVSGCLGATVVYFFLGITKYRGELFGYRYSVEQEKNILAGLSGFITFIAALSNLS